MKTFVIRLKYIWLIDCCECVNCTSVHSTLEIDIKFWFDHWDYNTVLIIVWVSLRCEHLSASRKTSCSRTYNIKLQLSIVVTNRNHWIIDIMMWVKSVIYVCVCPCPCRFNSLKRPRIGLIWNISKQTHIQWDCFYEGKQIEMGKLLLVK